ncbi:MAG: immunoglobulin domain-containing protein [Phycisphaerae bacterium]
MGDDVDLRDFGGFRHAYVGDCAIEITQQPFGITVCEGQAAQLSVSAVGPPGETLSYQWRQDGLDVVGATEDTLNIPAGIQSDNGSYRCIITATCAEIEFSAAVDLVVNAPPTEFLSHPIGGTQCIGSTIFLIASAGSNPTYQWFKDGEPIEGATSPFLVISNAVTEDSGAYHAEATNTCNSATFNDAVVEIIACPALGKQ